MAVELSFTPCPPLLQARRRAAPRARFDGATKRWTMTQAEYAAFWVEAIGARHDRLITVHRVDGRPVAETTPR